MANMFHKIGLTIIDDEGWPSESLRQFYTFYLFWKWRSRYLLQGFTYSITSRGLGCNKVFEALKHRTFWRWSPRSFPVCGDFFLLCLQRGKETVLSLWGRDCLFSRTQCDRETTLSLWGGDFLLSHSLCCSPMLCSSFHEWLGAGLGPFRRKSSSSLLACYCRANTYCFNISISLSLLDWDGTVVVVDLSSYKWYTSSLLWTCEGCTWFSLWTLNRNHLSSWTDSLDMLGWERSAGPFLDRFAILP